METKQRRIAIVGSRKFPNQQQVIDYVNQLPLDVMVVSGGAAGVDRWAVAAANQRGIDTKIYLPDWEKEGKQAGLNRNTTIVNDCDELVAFWDGASNGTRDSIDKARAAGKQVVIIKPYDPTILERYKEDEGIDED